jgi:dipeptidyl-peptidase-4
VFDVARATERLICDPADLGADVAGRGIDDYATDAAGRLAAIQIGGHLAVADLVTGEVNRRTTPGPVSQPRPDPTGRRVAYLSEGMLRVRDLATDEDGLLAGEPGSADVCWGGAEVVASREFGRTRGFWWAPDGGSVLAARVDDGRVAHWHVHDPAFPERAPSVVTYPPAGTPTAQVTLHLLDLDGGWVDVHWDRETYPYLVGVSWTEAGGPLVSVLRRLQQHGLVLAIDPRTGETQVHAELADPRWVEPVPGTPCHLSDGRVLIGGELAHDGYDARCLFADGGLLTPPSLYVRRVCGRLGADLLIEGSEGEPSEQHLYRVGTQAASGAAEVRRLTTSAGWHVGHAGGDTLVIGAASLDHSGTQWSVHARGTEIGQLITHAARPPSAPRPALARVTDRQLPTGVLYPRAHVAGRRLPVLVDANGGPGGQEVVAARSAWLARQWWADAGFAVVVIDIRGTPGVAPSFEKVVHRRLADVALTDQADALHALAEKHPDLDLDRLAIRGRGFGGWLAALAVLRRPEVFHCGVAVSPLADWTLCPAPYAERYLGPPGEAIEVYAHQGLLEPAAEPPAAGDLRPLLLAHDLTDDVVPVAHSLRLSAALLTAGRPHALIPLPAGSDPDRLLPFELDFVRRALGLT